MTLHVSDVIDSARVTLIDAAQATWVDAELIAYMNEGVQKTCLVKPDANVVYTTVTFIAGNVQPLADDVVELLDIICTSHNFSNVTQVDKALLQAADPTWASQPEVYDIEHFMFDPRSPRVFLVYPPAAAGSGVAAKLAKRPANAVARGDLVPLPEVYVPVLIDYVLGRAYAKNSKKQDLTKASFHLQQWAAALGQGAQALLADAPKITDGTPT